MTNSYGYFCKFSSNLVTRFWFVKNGGIWRLINRIKRPKMTFEAKNRKTRFDLKNFDSIKFLDSPMTNFPQTASLQDIQLGKKTNEN